MNIRSSLFISSFTILLVLLWAAILTGTKFYTDKINQQIIIDTQRMKINFLESEFKEIKVINREMFIQNDKLYEQNNELMGKLFFKGKI